MPVVCLPARPQHSDWSKAEAPWNIESISVTPETSHPERSWLKAEAELNMKYIVTAAETSQPPIGWLNAEAW